MLAALNLGGASLSAQVIKEHDFADGSRAGWYTSRLDTDLTASPDNGGRMTMQIENTTNQALTYFTASDALVLDIDQTLEVKIVFSFTSLSKTLNPFLRIGIFDSDGKRIHEDNRSNLVEEFRSYRGYGLFASRVGGLASSSKRTGKSHALMVDGGPWQTLSSFDRSAHSFTFIDDVDYTLTMQFKRVAAAEMAITYLLTFGNERFEYTFTDRDAIFTSFDTLAIACGGISSGPELVNAMTIETVRFEVIPGNETASAFPVLGSERPLTLAQKAHRTNPEANKIETY